MESSPLMRPYRDYLAAQEVTVTREVSYGRAGKKSLLARPMSGDVSDENKKQKIKKTSSSLTTAHRMKRRSTAGFSFFFLAVDILFMTSPVICCQQLSKAG